MTKTLITTAILTVTAIVGGAAVAQRMGMVAGYPYKSGQDIYTHVCQGCHMPDGKGAVGAANYGYPALANNAKLGAGLYPAMVVVRGQKAMPAFADLKDEQVAEVVNYVRSNFGNHYGDAVTAAQVAAIRPKPITNNNRGPG
jgi:mono/diheme cytochrome c family protein